MPRSPMSLCTTPGCPHLVPYGKCDEHKTAARRDSDSKRPNATQRGYDRKWQRFRADYLSRHRECEGERCMQLPWWRRPAATDVDHRDGLGPHGPRGYDESNMQPLCHPCHSAKTATQDGGFGRA